METPSSTTTAPNQPGQPISERAPPVRSRFRAGWRIWMWVILFDLLVYVLSAGPMYWTIYEAYTLEGSTFVYALYYPLVRASEFPPFSALLNWYLSWWVL